MEKLLARIQAYVGEGREKSNASATVLMIHIPILRAADGALERLDRRAFWIWENPLTLGESAGALFRGKDAPYHFYVDHLGAARYAEKTGWQEIKLDVLSVQDALTPELARTYSGVGNAGPRAVLAGAGALGSEIFRLWRRAGWGSWTVIDPDHMKPHNTSRHAHSAVGIPKAQALARADQALYRLQAPLVRAIATNAADTNDSEVREALASASLVVDATTTVEVPRRLSQLEYVPRTASCFITTSARDAVLLAEDQHRETRIDALEAQYYRAVLNQAWGEGHLTTSVAQFRSGTSCRDVSFVMPHSRIVAHAATLAEQVQNLGEQACIRVWCRDHQSGEVQLHAVDVRRALRVALNAFTLIWDEGTRDKLRALRQAALPSETGGVILGYHDFNEGMIYVVDVLLPPADSVGTPGGFQRGIEGLARTLAEVRARSGEQVGYLGEWHSHPDGVGVRPSPDDIKQLLFLGKILSQDGLPGLQLIVGTADEQWLLVQTA
jgi:integrative and conjugative element protein (TIGR02256 family)